MPSRSGAVLHPFPAVAIVGKCRKRRTLQGLECQELGRPRVVGLGVDPINRLAESERIKGVACSLERVGRREDIEAAGHRSRFAETAWRKAAKKKEGRGTRGLVRDRPEGRPKGAATLNDRD